MGDRSAIEWTDATWNPVVGCSKVSPGCDNCYAIRQAARIVGAHPDGPYQGIVADGDWTGVVRPVPERLGQPLRWRRPRRVFVNSMSDLFHPDVPDHFIAAVFYVMAVVRGVTGRYEHVDPVERAPDGFHEFQLLTKRPRRMASWTDRWVNDESFRAAIVQAAGDAGWLDECPQVFDWFYRVEHWPEDVLLDNIWLGTSIEADRYTFRADHLRVISGAVRFLSLEPLLGPLPSLDLSGIDWVIVGGESGPGARRMQPAWVRELRDRCVAAGVPFFFKQWGGLTPKANGRELDGRVWDEYPEPTAVNT